MNHTEKHWSVDGHNLYNVIEYTGKAWEMICCCKGFTIDAKSNSQLIAAAPDMLRALKNCLPYLKSEGTNGNHWVSEIESAINKAEGNPCK